MASSVSPPKRKCSTSDVLQSENFVLTVYSDSNRNDIREIAPLQKQFSKLFVEDEPTLRPKESKTHFKSTGTVNHCIYKPLNLCLVQVSNMIYPECENCRDAGWMACNSVLSGLYAKGITECDSIMMNLIMSLIVKPEIRDKVLEEIVAGFKACAADANVKVTNSPLLTCTFIVIGGTATTICHINDFATCDEAVVGDTIVLTKPLGTLVSARTNNEEFKSQFAAIQDPEHIAKIEEAYESALLCMRRSNKIASILMKKYNAHAAIDLNGHSIFQSAFELAKIQKSLVEFKIDLLPLIKHTKEIDEYVGSGLVKGNAQELCGGLLICFSRECAKDFIKEITTTEGPPCFYVGTVMAGLKSAKISPEPQIIPIKLQPQA